MSGLESAATEFGTLVSNNLQSVIAPRASDPSCEPGSWSGRGDTAAGPAMPASMAERAMAAFEDEALPPPPNDPAYVAALVRNALVLMRNSETRLAQNLLHNALLREPNHPPALRWLGQSFKETGRHEAALKCFRALYKAEPSAEHLYLVADILYVMERDEQALDLYVRAIVGLNEEPRRLFEIYKNMGNIHVRAGDYDSAEECYNKAYTLDSSSDVLMVNYGTLEIQRENSEQALARFRQAVEINPENDRGWVGLAMVHRQMGDHELAMGNLERAIDINPRNKTALRLMVDWGVHDRNLFPAVRRLEEYLALESEDTEMSFILAKAFTFLNRLTEAEIELERTLALDPALQGGVELMDAIRKERARASETP